MNDQKLTNKGWTAMRAALDREMPVERDRKPLAWLWWLLSLIPIVIVAVGMLWETPEPKQGPLVPTLPERPIAISPAGETRATETPDAISDTPARILPQKPVLPSTQTGFVAANEAHQGLSNRFDSAPSNAPSSTIRVAKNKAFTQTITENTAASAVHHTTTSAQTPTRSVSGAIAAAATENTASNPHTTAPIEPKDAAATTTPFMTLATLPSRIAQAPTLALHAPELVYFPISVDITRPARKPALQWSANASLWLDDRANASGGGGGLALDWRPLRRWGLRTGLHYIYQRPGEDRVVAVTNQSYYDATFDVNVLTSSPGIATPIKSTASSVLVPVSKMHWLEAPVSVFWEPIRRWRIYGGFSLMRNISAASADRTYAVSTAQILSVPDANQSALNQLIEMKLPNWQTAWTAGLSFQPLKHLELGLSYRFGIKNTLSALTPENTFTGNNPALPGRNNDPKFNGYQSNNVSSSNAGISSRNLLQLSATWLF